MHSNNRSVVFTYLKEDNPERYHKKESYHNNLVETSLKVVVGLL